jgi:hypothetical protein
LPSSRLLDEVAPVLGLRGEHRVDLALGDDRVHRAAEADVGEQLDEIGAADRSLVDEVLPPPRTRRRDRDLAEVDLVAEATVRVVEDELDLAVIGGGRFGAAEEDVVGFSARARKASATSGPDDRVGHVRLPGPFGPTTTATPGSSRLDRVDERLEAADLDRLRWRGRTLTTGTMSRGCGERLLTVDRHRLQRLPRGLLLGGLLGRGGADPTARRRSRRCRRIPVVRRP